MTTYNNPTRTKINYRKIYENNFGPIPVDSDGRTYDIHHIDGNDKNNDPSNLKAVSIQEHYDIHYTQGDFFAALRIASRMKLSPEQMSELATLSAKNQVEKGLHPWTRRADGSSSTLDRVINNTHNWQKREDGTSYASDRVDAGTHPWTKRSDGTSHATDRVNAGTHPWQIKGLIYCYNKQGEFKKLTKEEYYSQIGPMEEWEWVFQASKEGFERKKIKNPKAKPKKITKPMNGIVICCDKEGNTIKVDKTNYHEQTGPMENWEFVTINSKEGKKRKEGLK